LVLNINQDIINRAIYDQILKINPNYAPGPNCANDEECFIVSGDAASNDVSFGFHVIGVWADLKAPATLTDPGRIILNISLEVVMNSTMSYNTVLQVHFLFDDDKDYYYLEFDKLEMGKIPVPKSFFVTVLNALEKQGGIDLTSQLSDIPIGEVDLDTLSYTLPKDEILTTISDTGNTQDISKLLTQELLSVVFDNQLLNLSVEDQEFVLQLGVSKFSNTDTTDIPSYLYDLHDQTTVDGNVEIGEFNPDLFNPEEYLQDVFTQYIFSSTLLNNNGFTIDEETFNKLVYFNLSGFENARSVQEIQVSDTETKEIEVGLKAIWFEFGDEEMYVHALFTIGNIQSKLLIHATEVPTTDGTLQYTFDNITLGKDAGENSGDYIEILDLSMMKQVFAQLGDVDFATFTSEGDLVISPTQLSTLLQDGTQPDAVTVTDVSMTVGGITLTVEPNGSLDTILNTFQDALITVLGDNALLTNLQSTLDTTDGGAEEAIYEAVESIQTTLNESGTITQDQIDDLFQSYNKSHQISIDRLYPLL